jgi:hypothetical protein
MIAAIRRITFIILIGITSAVLADEFYVIRFHARGKTSGCRQAEWAGDALLYNQNSHPATVHLLDVSGELPSGVVTDFTLAPKQTYALSKSRITAAWRPRGAGLPSLWILHLQVPSGVIIEGRDEVYEVFICTSDPSPGPPVKTSLPVFAALAPPGSPQVKLGTDLGSASARQNVAIYNSGNQTATAFIEVRRGCDDGVVDSRTVTIPARTISQFGGFGTGSGQNECRSPQLQVDIPVNHYIRYTVITVDQPSISFVSTLTELQASSLDTVIPLLEFAVK